MISDYNGLNIQIHILLKKIGMPAHIRGYKFVKQLVFRCLDVTIIYGQDISVPLFGIKNILQILNSLLQFVIT